MNQPKAQNVGLGGSWAGQSSTLGLLPLMRGGASSPVACGEELGHLFYDGLGQLSQSQ